MNQLRLKELSEYTPHLVRGQSGSESVRRKRHGGSSLDECIVRDEERDSRRLRDFGLAVPDDAKHSGGIRPRTCIREYEHLVLRTYRQ